MAYTEEYINEKYKSDLFRLSQILCLSILFQCCHTSNIGEKKLLVVTFEVEGMVIRDGVLWMGWPTEIGTVLDELTGIDEYDFDINTRRFQVVFDTAVVSRDKIVSAIEDLGRFRVINWQVESEITGH